MKTGNNFMLLSGCKLKTTKSRIAILDILNKAKHPYDVETIIIHLIKKKIIINQATVYRILDVFTRRKLIKKLEFQEGKFRYELTTLEHHHLICENCGAIKDVTDCPIADVQKSIASKYHFLITNHALEFFGLCSKCQR